jgi:hypothetical protein
VRWRMRHPLRVSTTMSSYVTVPHPSAVTPIPFDRTWASVFDDHDVGDVMAQWVAFAKGDGGLEDDPSAGQRLSGRAVVPRELAE